MRIFKLLFTLLPLRSTQELATENSDNSNNLTQISQPDDLQSEQNAIVLGTKSEYYEKFEHWLAKLPFSFNHFHKLCAKQ